MYGFHGMPTDVDVFAYHLAHQLKKTISDIEAMPHAEYVHWAAYFTAKHAIENKSAREVGA